MPIDNDYFKNRQKQQNNSSNNSSNNNGGGNNGGGNGGGGYQPPFEPPQLFKGFGKGSAAIYAIIIIGVVLFMANPFVVINSGEVGIKVTTGKYESEPLQPGFHLYVPVLQKVITVDTKVRLINYKTIEDMSGFDSGIKINPAINILDARGLPVSIELTVQYKLLPAGAPNTIATWGLSWEDKIVNPIVRNIVRNVIGGYNAEELPTKRNEIATQIENGIRSQIEAQGRADAVTIEADAQAKANKLVAESLTPKLLQMQQIQVQGKFNDALRENKDAKIFLTPGGSTPNIWVDTKDKQRDTAVHR